MKNVENMKQFISKKVINASLNTVKNTVGKSHPAFAHEVKMPKEIKDSFSK